MTRSQIARRILMAQERMAIADASYERGWSDSLDAHYFCSLQPGIDRYWYNKGWYACADYRWTDPINRGVAQDRDYKEPRT